MIRRPSRAARPCLSRFAAGLALAAVASLGVGLSGCAEQYDHGYVAADNAVEQVQVGTSREQVQLILGSPSTTATVGGEAYYYISQHTSRPVAFLEPKVTDQKVLAVYFDEQGRVKEVANYGLQDGKVFDFIGRKTKSSGSDFGLLSQMLKANPSNPLISNN